MLCQARRGLAHYEQHFHPASSRLQRTLRGGVFNMENLVKVHFVMEIICQLHTHGQQFVGWIRAEKWPRRLAVYIQYISKSFCNSFYLCCLSILCVVQPVSKLPRYQKSPFFYLYALLQFFFKRFVLKCSVLNGCLLWCHKGHRCVSQVARCWPLPLRRLFFCVSSKCTYKRHQTEG